MQADAGVLEGAADEGMAEDVMDSDEDFLKAFWKKICFLIRTQMPLCISSNRN